MTPSLIERLDQALAEVNHLNVAARREDASDLMYAANRAWHELHQARQRFLKATNASAKGSVQP